MRFAAAGVLLVLVAACRKEPASPSCSDRVKTFEEALAAPGAGNCSTDADCKCFRGGVSEKHGCGGITDAKTNDALVSIAKDYDGAQCKSGINCAAWSCSPSCQSGKCTNAPPPPPTSPTSTAKPEAAEAGLSCDARMTEIDRVIASGTNKCKTDKDCVCFRGGVSKEHPCGDITDAKTNERFESLAKQFSAAGCKLPNVMCPAMVCDPTCNAGTCGPRQLIQ